jgi:DNA polymerase III subunit delta
VQVRLAQLTAHLAKGLAPLYVIHGDEPLLAIEAGDQVRAAARSAGFEAREVLVADPGFNWDAFATANRNLGLFGAHKLVDLRIPSGKPGVDGARVLEDCAANPHSDTLTLITLPRLDRAGQSSAWFSALDHAGVVVAVQAVERAELPRWIAARLARQNQHGSADTLQFLAATTEGNLLAAMQEVEKLGLLLPKGELDPDAVLHAIADVARFDVFQLSEAWLAGDAARALRILAALETQGEAVPLLIWQLGEDLHALSSVLNATAGGTPLSTAIRATRVWGKRQAALEHAARRVEPAAIATLLQRLARVDEVAKGIGRGSAWDGIADIVLALAGRAPRPAASAGY